MSVIVNLTANGYAPLGTGVPFATAEAGMTCPHSATAVNATVTPHFTLVRRGDEIDTNISLLVLI